MFRLIIIAILRDTVDTKEYMILKHVFVNCNFGIKCFFVSAGLAEVIIVISRNMSEK
jgi:hypothetical protein